MRTRKKIAYGLLVTTAVLLLSAGSVLVVTYRSARKIAAVSVAGPWSFVDSPVYVGTRLVRGRTFPSLPYWEVTHADPTGRNTSRVDVDLEAILQARRPQYGESWRYDGRFHTAIKNADSIVVRAGGFDCCGPVDEDPVLFEIIDPDEVEAVFRNLEFKTNQAVDACMCCGGPGIDWYKGKKRIALTACQDSALCWKGFPGPKKYSDAQLTRESGNWLSAWIKKHRGTAEDQDANKPDAGDGK